MKLSNEELELLVIKRNEAGLEHTVEVMTEAELARYRENCVEAIARNNDRIARTSGIMQQIAIEIVETLESYIAYIDEKLKEAPKGIAAIDAFLNDWKEKVVSYYVEAIEQFNAINKEGLSSRERVMKRNSFLYKFSKTEASRISFLSYRQNYLELLEDDIETQKRQKRILLIQRITKKAGTIVDASDLYIGDSGEINGIVVGDKSTVEVRTVSAGGYNIQCYHYRVLVK